MGCCLYIWAHSGWLWHKALPLACLSIGRPECALDGTLACICIPQIPAKLAKVEHEFLPISSLVFSLACSSSYWEELRTRRLTSLGYLGQEVEWNMEVCKIPCKSNPDKTLNQLLSLIYFSLLQYRRQLILKCKTNQATRLLKLLKWNPFFQGKKNQSVLIAKICLPPLPPSTIFLQFPLLSSMATVLKYSRHNFSFYT